MTNKTLGQAIRDARTAADLTQEKLARKISGLSAADISAAERGEAELTQDQLKRIAKATGVTQSSLLRLKKTRATASAVKKTAAAKKTAAKPKTPAKPRTPASAGLTMRVTATEKRLVEAYRAADTDTKKRALAILKGENADPVGSLLSGDGLADTVGDLLGSLLGKK